MIFMRASPLRGDWALELEIFVGPLKLHEPLGECHLGPTNIWGPQIFGAHLFLFLQLDFLMLFLPLAVLLPLSGKVKIMMNRYIVDGSPRLLFDYQVKFVQYLV